MKVYLAHSSNCDYINNIYKPILADPELSKIITLPHMEKDYMHNRNYYEDFDLVALLAKQIVAGTNYMYLVKNEKEYKILVVYNDLDGNAIVNSLTKFNYVDYTRKEIDNNSKNLSGGWIADYPSNQNLLPNENIQKAFDDATKELTGISFNPITVLGTQVVAGKNYAILSYGKLSTQSAETGIYLLTVYEDLEGNSKLIGNAYIDLSKYNN